MKIFIWLVIIEKTPPTIKLNNIIQFINLDSPDLPNIISLVEEINIKISVKKYKTYFKVLEKSII